MITKRRTTQNRAKTKDDNYVVELGNNVNVPYVRKKKGIKPLSHFAQAFSTFFQLVDFDSFH